MSTKHVLYLDSLRGAACMNVVFLHTVMELYPGLHNGIYTGASINYKGFLLCPPFSILLAGQAAVCLFFVLSGYVLSYRFMGEGGMKLKLVEATIKRPIRLAGVILFTLLPIFYFLLTKNFWSTRLWIDYDVYLRTAYNAVTSIFSPVMYFYNSPMWTINIEIWGSFLTFGLCFVIGNWPKPVRMLLMSGMLLYFRHDYYVAFIFGIMMADLHKNWNIDWFIKHKNTISYILLVPALLLFSYQYYLVPEKQWVPNATFINSGYSMIGAMLIFVFVICNDRIKAILEIRPLVLIGGISYSVYLLHYMLIHRYEQSVYNLAVSYFGLNVYLTFLIMFAIMLVIILGFSWLVDKWVDKPCIQLSAWFAKKLVMEIQDRIEFVRNMTTAIFKNIKALITIFLQKYRNTQDSFVLVQASEKDDNLSLASEDNGTKKEDNKHDRN